MLKKIIGTILAVSVTAASLGVGSVSTSRANNGRQTEIVAIRSKYEKHYANSDGTRTAYVSTVPLHYFDGEKWADIDNSLELDENGFYVNKSNSFDVRLGEYLDRDSDNSLISINCGDCSIDITPAAVPSASNSSRETAKLIETDKESLSNESKELFSKLKSAVEYENAFGDLDLQVEVKPEDITEKVVIGENDEIPEVIQYLIRTDASASVDQETGSILFSDNNGTIVYETPEAFMYDSSSETEQVFLETELENCDDGYILSIYPDTNWLTNNDITYPVTLPLRINLYNNLPGYYISQITGKHTGTYSLTIGGNIGEKNEAYIYYPSSFNYADNYSITGVRLFAYFLKNNQSGNNVPLHVKMMMNSEPSSWENTDLSYELASSTIHDNGYGYYYFDLPSEMVYAWVNNEKTNGLIGKANNGVKIITSRANASRLYNIISDYDPTSAPFFTISYSSYSNEYYSCYTPDKYNAFGTSGIDNFQNRMNCYAYALQVYYNGTLSSGGAYYLKPGEFGISQPASLTYPASTYGSLSSFYDDFTTTIKNATTDYARRTICRNYMKFIEEEMSRDAAVLNFSITPLKSNYNAYNYVADNDFTLPATFDSDSERFIALTVYHYKKWNSFIGAYVQALDYHYYIRNGNGTCDDPAHGSNCSKWTHKMAQREVDDHCPYYSTISLCDENIGDYACSFSNCEYTPNEVRYYIIDKDVNVYGSAHGNGAYDSSTGTPYYGN